MLKLEGVTVRYGDKTVVDNVHLTVEPGQWLMLCGPNGAGKSTLVNAVARGVQYGGNISFMGRDIKSMKPAELARNVGVLTQSNMVSYAFTVEEVVTMGRYAHARGFLSRTDEEGPAHVEAAIKATGLSDIRHQNMLTLSGGEMQRAFLAQVFAQGSPLLILDEPVNHLDLVFQKQIFSLIVQWLKTPGRAVISVVHDLSLARKYGTHALLLHEGRAVAQGETADVLTRRNLERVYHMDVYAWMRDMLSRWEDRGEAAARIGGQ